MFGLLCISDILALLLICICIYIYIYVCVCVCVCVCGKCELHCNYIACPLYLHTCFVHCRIAKLLCSTAGQCRESSVSPFASDYNWRYVQHSMPTQYIAHEHDRIESSNLFIIYKKMNKGIWKQIENNLCPILPY